MISNDTNESVDINLIKNFIKDISDIVMFSNSNIHSEEDIKQAFKEIKNHIVDHQDNTSKTSNEPKQENGSSKEASTELKRVLIVDDLFLTTHQVKILLSNKGFSVTSANNISDAIQLFKTQRYDYVILDYFLPTEEEGQSLIKIIKKLKVALNLNTTVVLMSSCTIEEIGDPQLRNKIDVFVEKTGLWQKDILDACN